MLQLMAECVQLLRDRVESAHPDALSDETLGAVATMAAIEVSSSPFCMNSHNWLIVIA